MMVIGTVSTAAGGRFRVSIGGCISAEIPALDSAYRLEIDFEAKRYQKHHPVVGDRVLCAFLGDGYASGYILGLVEGE